MLDFPYTGKVTATIIFATSGVAKINVSLIQCFCVHFQFGAPHIYPFLCWNQICRHFIFLWFIVFRVTLYMQNELINSGVLFPQDVFLSFFLVFLLIETDRLRCIDFNIKLCIYFIFCNEFTRIYSLIPFKPRCGI